MSSFKEVSLVYPKNNQVPGDVQEHSWIVLKFKRFKCCHEGGSVVLEGFPAILKMFEEMLRDFIGS